MAGHWLVLAAAGAGRRMGADRPKQYLRLAGRSVLEHSLDRLLALPVVRGAVVVLAADDTGFASLNYASHKPLWRAEGGAERCRSVLNGLLALDGQAAEDDWVLVHDAARPCVRPADLERLVNELADDPVGGLLAVPVRDTLKRADASGRVVATEARDALWQAQTPQMFRYGVLRQALQSGIAAKHPITDEAAAVEALGLRPRLIIGHYDNLKITTAEDLVLAEHCLHQEYGHREPWPREAEHP